MQLKKKFNQKKIKLSDQKLKDKFYAFRFDSRFEKNNNSADNSFAFLYFPGVDVCLMATKNIYKRT